MRASRFAAFNFAFNGCPTILRLRVKAHNVEQGHRIAIMASHMLAAPNETSIRPLADKRPEVDSTLAANTEMSIAAATTAVLEDSRVLMGRVPQCQGWFSAWAESTEQIAFHRQARLSAKKQLSGSKKKLTRRQTNLRWIRRKQVRVMAEARREVLRNCLAEHSLFLFRWVRDSIKRSCASDTMLQWSLTFIEESLA